MKTSFLKHLVRNLDTSRALQYSYKDYHAEGVDYLNLAYGEDLVVKVYFFRPELHPVGPHDCVVHPHNHRYDFETHVLSGELTNVNFRPAWPNEPGAELYHEFRYFSPLRGARDSEYAGKVWVGTPILGKRLTKGESYFLNSSEVHSIIVNRSPLVKRTVIALMQFRDNESEFTSLFMRENTLPNTSGLYGRFSRDEIKAMAEAVEYLLHEEK